MSLERPKKSRPELHHRPRGGYPSSPPSPQIVTMGNATCDDQVPAHRPGDLRGISRRFKSMGMDQKCERKQVRTKSGSNETRCRVHELGLPRSLHAGSRQHQRRKRAERNLERQWFRHRDPGLCADPELDANINCIMQNTTTETTVSASAGASISIRIIEGEMDARLERQVEQFTAAAERMAALKMPEESRIQKRQVMSQWQWQRGVRSYQRKHPESVGPTDIKVLSVTELTSNQDFRPIRGSDQEQGAAETTHTADVRVKTSARSSTAVRKRAGEHPGVRDQHSQQNGRRFVQYLQHRH